MGRSILAATRALAALAVLAALTVGWPLALAAAVGWPLPTTLPTLEQLSDAAATGIDDTAMVKTLAVVGWLAWAQITAAVLLEAVAAVRGRSAPRRRFVLSSAQNTAAHLIAGILLAGQLASSPPALAAPNPAIAGQVPAVGAIEPVSLQQESAAPEPVDDEPDHHGGGDVPGNNGDRTGGSRVAYRVERHDTYWDIAERFLGDGQAWQQIRDLNAGRTMPDGRTVSATSETIHPEWLLLLPESVDPDTPGVLPASDIDAEPARAEVTVEAGDHLWDVAVATLTGAWSRPPSNAEIDTYWRRLIETNHDLLVDPANPDLILPEQQFRLPPIPEDPAPAPSQPPSQGLDAPPLAPVEIEARGPQGPEPGVAEPSSPPDGGASEHAETSRQDAGTSEDTETPIESGESGLLLPGLLGVAGVGIAVGVAHGHRRRRLRALQLTPRCSKPPDPPAELDEVRRDLLLADDPTHIQSLHAALADLAVELAGRPRDRCRPRLAQVATDRIEVLLSETTLPAPPGWQPEASGAIWVRDLDHDPLEEATPTESDESFLLTPAPCAVTIGRPETSGQIHLDLEAHGLLAINGDPDACAGLLRSVLLELANNPFGSVPVIAVGEGSEAWCQQLDDVRVADTWEDVADDVLAWAQQSRDLLAANRWPDPFTARVRAPHHDGLAPLVVVCHQRPTAATFDELCDLAADSATTLTLVIVGDTVPGATRLEIDPDELHIPTLGLTCHPQAVTRAAAEQIVEALDHADQLPDPSSLVTRPIPEPEGDDDPSSGLRSAHPGEVDQYEDPEYDILVRLLGPIEVVGGNRPLRPKETALAAYVALHAPVPAEQIEDAVWTAPTKDRRKRLANTISQCRSALGAQHLPASKEGRYTVGPRLRTDVDLFRRRVEYAASQPADTAIPVLKGALELVTGPVFTYPSRDRSAYVWVDLENWHTTWDLEVTEAATDLAELCLNADDVDGAIGAANTGLLASPTHPALTEPPWDSWRLHALERGWSSCLRSGHLGSRVRGGTRRRRRSRRCVWCASCDASWGPPRGRCSGSRISWAMGSSR